MAQAKENIKEKVVSAINLDIVVMIKTYEPKQDFNSFINQSTITINQWFDMRRKIAIEINNGVEGLEGQFEECNSKIKLILGL